MTELKAMMTLEEVADFLNVNYQLVYRLVRSGDLTAVRIGRVYRVTREDLQAYLARSKTTAGSGGVCAACGTVYQSVNSLKHGCTECEAAICADCWLRKNVRTCKEHGK